MKTPFQEFAEIALALVAQSAVKANDESLKAAQGCRAFLSAIASGELLVIEADVAAQMKPR